MACQETNLKRFEHFNGKKTNIFQIYLIVIVNSFMKMYKYVLDELNNKQK